MNAEYERLRLCAARYAYVRADQHCPNPLQNGNRITWRKWWERKFGHGESLEEYAHRQAARRSAEDRRSRVG